MKNKNEIDIQLSNFEQSLIRLKEVLQRDYSTDDIVLDATIQRFEFTFENAWKTIKLILKESGVDAMSPKDAIKKAYRNGWIKDESVFLNLLKSRNLRSHTYAKPIAISVYETIKDNVSAFDSLLEELQKAK